MWPAARPSRVRTIILHENDVGKRRGANSAFSILTKLGSAAPVQ
jgi:hypothetical protein